MKKVVPFAKARATSLYGSKAVGLGEAARHGLPVPPGVALSGDLVEAVASGEDKAVEKVAKAIAALPTPFAVRSSAVDEDGAAASFAGQHITLLNIHSPADVPGAVREVWWSANSDSAITYRQRVGLFTRPSVGVVVQTLLNPTVAGVMFTENPVTGADERMIEASWGLGEAVVAGLVVPDNFRVNRSGQVLEHRAGRKRIAIRSLPNGGTFEQQMPPAQVTQLCLDDAQLAALGELALQCEKAYGPRRDIEWAYQDGTLYLLQCRAITTGKARSEGPPPGPPPAIPWPPSNASDSSMVWTGGRPSKSPACSRSATSRRTRPSSWRAPEARPSSSSTPERPRSRAKASTSPPSARATTSARSP